MSQIATGFRCSPTWGELIGEIVSRAGSGVGATETLHRIDPARIKADVLAAGFKLDAESTILANKADDHTKIVFDRRSAVIATTV